MVHTLSDEFIANLYQLCLKEADRIKGSAVVTPDAITGLDAGKIVYVDLISDNSVVALKPGWFASQAGITGKVEVEIRFFEGALTFIPWTNISNTRDR